MWITKNKANSIQFLLLNAIFETFWLHILSNINGMSLKLFINYICWITHLFFIYLSCKTYFSFSFSDSNVFGRSDRHCAGFEEIRHLHFNIHSSLLKLKSFLFISFKIYIYKLCFLSDKNVCAGFNNHYQWNKENGCARNFNRTSLF